jgi:hypothetical protein
MHSSAVLYFHNHGRKIMKGMLKWPLVIAAIVVVLRVAMEQWQAPEMLTNLVSVVALYLVICPVYFAFRIAGSGIERPYRQLLKSIALYAALARSFVIPTYWLAYIYQWQAPRFALDHGGVVGPNVTPLRAFVLTPLVAGIAWVLGSLIIGGALGSAVIAIFRRK